MPLDKKVVYLDKAPLEVKKDKAFYYMQSKQKIIKRKKQLQEARQKLYLQRAEVKKNLPLDATPLAVSVHTSSHTATVADAIFAVGSLVSIIPDSSDRGYKCNKISGKVTAVHQ